jgi:dTDP-4-amino-4,6-dideoxygalactose transaminase
LNSCTAALHLSLVALGIGPGDEVITTPLTFCATVNSILHVGAKPVLADVGEDGNIDPREIEKRITPRTRALLPVHLAGLPCDMNAIWDLASRHGLKVIEDAAHAVGTFYKNEHLGGASSRSDTVTYSFYATKNLTTGEGGMVTCNDPILASRLRRLALHGIARDAWKRYRQDGSWFYEVVEPGFKYNLGDLQSAIGIQQLRKLERFIAVRTKHAALYRELLGDIEELELPEDAVDGRHAWHLFMLRLRTEKLRISRNEFIERLRAHNIGTSVHFIPIPLHPFFANSVEMRNASPSAIALYHRLISLPLYPSLTEEQIHRVCGAVRRIVISARKTAVAARIAG